MPWTPITQDAGMSAPEYKSDLIDTAAAFDLLVAAPLFEALQAGPMQAAIDTETTWVNPDRGYNPFYGTRTAMVSVSFDLDGEKFDFGINLRMKRGLLSLPTLPKATKANAETLGISRDELIERRKLLREAHASWLDNGDVAAFEAHDWLVPQLEIEEVQNIPVDRVIPCLNELTRQGLVWIFKNKKFDLLMLYTDGMDRVPLAQQEDVEVQSHLTEDKPWVKGKRVSHKLQDLAERHFEREPESKNALEDWFAAMKVPEKKRDYSAVPARAILCDYAAAGDTRDTLDLHGFFDRKMGRMDEESLSGRTLRQLYWEENETIAHLVDKTIWDGVRVNQGKADELLKKYEGVRAVHEDNLFKLAGERPIDWGSEDTVRAYLFDSPAEGGLGLEVPSFGWTPKGKRSVNKRVIEHLDVPITRELLEWRQADTFVNTFLEPIARFNIDGFIHPDFWLTTVRTGRISCSHPNMQNRPKDVEIREMFVARDGYVLLMPDYDQVEMRLTSHYAKRVCEALPDFWFQTYWRGKPSRWVHSVQRTCPMWDGFMYEPGYDPHQTFADATGLPRKREKSGIKTAKEGNFSILYGAGIPGLMREFGWEKAFAKKVRTDWRKTYPEVVHLQNFLTDALQRRGFITNEFGRRYYIDLTYLGLNYLIQGTAGDLMKRAMNRIYRFADHMQEACDGPRPIFVSNTVHDELMIEVREDLLTPKLAGQVDFLLTDWRREDGSDMFMLPITAGTEVAESDWGHPVPFIKGEPGDVNWLRLFCDQTTVVH
jgi:DNA polymerase I-like protein with 3'-5' exonuclease and polymerase domains